MKILITFILLVIMIDINAQSTYDLDIIINSIENDIANADFKYTIQTDDSIKDKLQYFHLPFNNSTNLQISTSGELNNQILTYGFNETTKSGYCVLSSSHQKNKLHLYIKDVVLPVQNSPLNKNNIKLSILFDSESIRLANTGNNLIFINALNIKIHSQQIILSKPKYQSTDDKGIFRIGEFENKGKEKILYLELPRTQTNHIILIILFIGALLLGLFGAPRIIKKKGHSQIALGLSILSLIGVIYFWFSMIYQSEHEFNFDIVSIVGGVIGLLLAILYSSWKNLIELKAIDAKTD